MRTRIFVAAGLLAAMIASPALAQTTTPQRTEASASDQGSRPSDVYVGGRYVGSDPDPNIRAQLPREHGGTEW